MGLYKYIREAWKKPKETLSDLMHERLIQWRTEPSTLRIDYPTRLDRARSLGYKAKPGIFMVRQRVMRGGHKRPQFAGGRRSKRYHTHKNLNLSYQTIAEVRANKPFQNCEVLNSYFLAKDGKNNWYEVIMIDSDHPAILADKNLNWLSGSSHKGRVNKGLTASGKRSRKRITM